MANCGSWQNIYLFAGAATIVWGIFVFFALPDDPTMARMLNDRERYVALERVTPPQSPFPTLDFTFLIFCPS